MAQGWQHTDHMASRSYICAWCGNKVASSVGYGFAGGNSIIATLNICPHCNRPTFFDQHSATQSPAPAFGEPVKDITDKEVDALYTEARNCMKVGAYTASVFCCRKLLMNIAVSKGAEVGQSFKQYVNYLSENHHVPVGGQDWVDHIREKGNEANHEIALMGENDAKDLIQFSEMLLKLLYEYPAIMARKKPPTA